MEAFENFLNNNLSTSKTINSHGIIIQPQRIWIYVLIDIFLSPYRIYILKMD